MSETTGINVLQNAANVEMSTALNGYSGVRIYVGTDDDGNEIIYQAGNMDAQVLDIKNPFGTQEMANNILASILGYQYQPLTATDALLDPAAELGDGVTVNSVYSGIFTRATKFGPLMATDISAPTNEEIEHEYAIESPSDRQYTRFVQQTKATLSITATQIRAEMVTKEGGNTQTFGWTLTSAGHKWYSGSQTVMQIDSSGLKVKGQIDVGTTVGSSSGFTISAKAIYNGISEFDGTQDAGVYIGTDGIQLGSNFKVDRLGTVSARSLNLTGNITFYNANGQSVGTLSANDLKSQVSHAYGSTSAGGFCYGGATNGNSAKDTWDLASDRNRNGVTYLKAQTLVATSVLMFGAHALKKLYLTVNGVTYSYVAWADPV